MCVYVCMHACAWCMYLGTISFSYLLFHFGSMLYICLYMKCEEIESMSILLTIRFCSGVIWWVCVDRFFRSAFRLQHLSTLIRLRCTNVNYTERNKINESSFGSRQCNHLQSQIRHECEFKHESTPSTQSWVACLQKRVKNELHSACCCSFFRVTRRTHPIQLIFCN